MLVRRSAIGCAIWFVLRRSRHIKKVDGIYMICSKTTLQRYSATTIAGTVERKLSLLNLPKTMFSLEAKAVIFSKTESTERGSIYT